MDCDEQINLADAGSVQSLFGTCAAPRDVCPPPGRIRTGDSEFDGDINHDGSVDLPDYAMFQLKFAP